MTNLERAVAILARHREARQWSDEAVAADLLAEMGVDAAAQAPVREHEVTAAEVAAQEAADKAAALRAALSAALSPAVAEPETVVAEPPVEPERVEAAPSEADHHPE